MMRPGLAAMTTFVMLAAFTAGCSGPVAENPQSAQPTNPAAGQPSFDKPTVVLVHGAFANLLQLERRYQDSRGRGLPGHHGR